MDSAARYSNGNGVCISCSGETATKLTCVKLACAAGENLPPPGSSAAELLDLINDFVRGQAIYLPLAALDLSPLSDFELNVLQALRCNVPRSKVVSYATLAGMSGNLRAVRAVGAVLRKNLFPLFFPCHRVIASDGTPGGFLGEKDVNSAGPALKRQLLLNEGVIFLQSGKIHMESIIRL